MSAEAPKRDAAAKIKDAAAAFMTGVQGRSADSAGSGGALPARVLAALPVGVALLDADLRWRYANDAFLSLTGLPAEAAEGRPLGTTPLGHTHGAGTGAARVEMTAAAHAAALVLADGETRELVTGPAEEPVRIRLQRVDPVQPVDPVRHAGPAAGASAGAAATGPGHAEPGTEPAPTPDQPMVLVVALLAADPTSGPGATRPHAVERSAPGAVDRAASAQAAAAPDGVSVSSASAAAPTDGELRARRRLDMLTAAGERIGTTLDTDTTCAELARFTVPGLADLATVDILPPGVPEHRPGMPLGTVRLLRAAVAGKPELHGQLGTLAHPGESVRQREGSLVARSLVAGKPVLLDLAATEEGAEGATAVSDPATLAVYRAAGITSVLAVPLTARGQLLGALTLARAPHTTHPPGPSHGRTVDAEEGERAAGADVTGDTAHAGATGDADAWADEGYSDEDIALIEDVAARAALSIDNARRYMRSQGIALELQRALLAEPANPHPNMEIACRYLPSGSSSVVGGDWYESVRLPFGRTLLVIGDVMGHGVEAAVDMSTYRSMLRYVAVMDLPPHRILRQLDALISENEAARPATCLLALVDPPRNRVTFASAGHLPPALVDPTGVTELVPVPSGPPLGTGVGGYQQLVRELTPGATLLLYTDGLVERRHEDIDTSLERLASLPLPAVGDLDDLLDAALHGSTPGEAEDDIAVLAARVRPRPS